MNKQSNKVIMFVASCLGSIVLFVMVASTIYSSSTEYKKYSVLKSQLPNEQELKNEITLFENKLNGSVQNIKNEISRRDRIIASATFVCFPKSKIPEFISEIQRVFNGDGISLIGLGYKERKQTDSIIILPFEAEFTCSYSGMRRLLYMLESHDAGIKIDQLKFVNFDNENHKLELKLSCTARFKAFG